MSSAFDWRAKAACRDKDPELFFPVGNTGAAYQQIEEAKAVCRTCKVIDACLKCALDTNQDYGVWGGLSEDERRALKRRALRARRSLAMLMQVLLFSGHMEGPVVFDVIRPALPYAIPVLEVSYLARHAISCRAPHGYHHRDVAPNAPFRQNHW